MVSRGATIYQAAREPCSHEGSHMHRVVLLGLGLGELPRACAFDNAKLAK